MEIALENTNMTVVTNLNPVSHLQTKRCDAMMTNQRDNETLDSGSQRHCLPLLKDIGRWTSKGNDGWMFVLDTICWSVCVIAVDIARIGSATAM